MSQDTLNANRSDTSQTKQELKNKNKIIHHYNLDRSTHKYLTTESQRFSVPTKKEYYHPPVTAQQTLNAAMKVLRNQLENSIASSRFYQILTKIAPYINNVFVFGYFNQTVPVVPATNPYLYPQTKKGQNWRNFMEDRHYLNPGYDDQD